MSARRPKRDPVHHPNKTAQDNQPVGERQRVRDADWRRNQPSDKRTAKHMARYSDRFAHEDEA